MPLNNIKPSPKQDWKLELIHEEVLDCNFMCDVYGLAKLPAHQLKYIWDSTSGRAWQKQVDDFRAGIYDFDKYVEVLNNYLLEINDAVANSYPTKDDLGHTYKRSGLLHLPFKVLYYIKADDTKVVIAKFLRDTWNISRFYKGLDPFVLGDVFFKMLPNLVQKSTDFPDPPTEVRDAIIMQPKSDKKYPKSPEAPG